MTEQQKTTELTDKEQIKADKPWLFKKGQSGNPAGLKPLTKEQKLIKKIKKTNKEIIEDYVSKLTEALPKISPVLLKMAQDGDIIAIKEVNSRIMGNPKTSIDLTTGGKPFIPTKEEEDKSFKALEDI